MFPDEIVQLDTAVRQHPADSVGTFLAGAPGHDLGAERHLHFRSGPLGSGRCRCSFFLLTKYRHRSPFPAASSCASPFSEPGLFIFTLVAAELFRRRCSWFPYGIENDTLSLLFLSRCHDRKIIANAGLASLSVKTISQPGGVRGVKARVLTNCSGKFTMKHIQARLFSPPNRCILDE